MIPAAAIIAVVAVFVLREWQHTQKENSSAQTANDTINVLFAQLDASREREAASFQKVIDVQNKTIKDQQKVIETMHSRLAMPAESAAADLNEQYTQMKNPVNGADTPAKQELTRLEDLDWAGVTPPDLNDLQEPQMVPDESPLDL